MIAKVLWQTWLNRCVIKIIYTTSMEQHLGYVLWNWKRSLLESQPPRCGSHVLNTNPQPSDCLVWASPASHPTYLQRWSAASPIYLYHQLPLKGTAGDPRGRCRGAVIPFSSSKAASCAPGDALTGVREKATAFEIAACHISEQDLALFTSMSTTSSLFCFPK